jgi:oxygen-independent coproporphyrinogen-3 oxidase
MATSNFDSAGRLNHSLANPNFSPVARRAVLDDVWPVIRHLYFHIPFCPRLCPYCSFYVETSMRTKNRAFLDALLNEVRRHAQAFAIEPETIYFGGGTPSMLSIAELEYLLGGLRAMLPLDGLREWTFEVNPATVSAAKAGRLRELGVNRVSVGVQSWDDGILKTLGRAHTAVQAEGTYRVLRDAGFENINLDLMFAIPGQSREQWRETLRRTVALGPEHISAYCLTYEEDTRYFEQLQSGEFHREDERDAAMFEETMDMLTAAGYGQYEISNYARPGRESLHNFGYWNGDDYLGIGPSAFSTVGTRRWQNVPDSAAYMARIGACGGAVSFEETIAEKTRAGETLAFGLRTERGIAAQAAAPWEAELVEMRALGLLETDGGRLRLTRRGKLLADSVAEAFV